MMRKTDTVLIDPLVALVLLTRIPLPRLPEHAFEHQSRAVWAYPAVGLVVGGLAGALGLVIHATGAPAMVAAGLVLLVQVVATGVMHEDGLADSCDGLWGGHTPERRLDIMRDSRIGAYGVAALIFSIGLRWAALASLPVNLLWPAVVATAMLSRAMMPCLMYGLPYARADGLAASVGRPKAAPVLIGLGLAVMATLYLTGGAGILAIGGAAIGTRLVWRLAKTRIGGQTGDILGATQQVSEIAMLLIFATLLFQ